MPIIHMDLIQLEFQPISSNKNLCVSVILENNPVSISKQCIIHLVKDGLTPQILQLTPTSVVLIQIPQYTLIAPNGTRQQYRGCDRVCIKTYECGSTFISDYFVLPAKITGCFNDSIPDQTLFPTNLAIIYALFNATELNALHTSLLLSQELSIQIPKIKIVEVVQHQHLEAEKQARMDLQKLAQQLDADQTLFDTQINALTHSMSESLPNFNSFNINCWKDWVILSISLLTVSLFVIYRVVWRVKYIY